MPDKLEIIDTTPELLETIITAFGSKEEKNLARQIVKCFTDNGLPVKIKQYHQECMKGTFRILCFIKKSTEAVIINNRGMGHDGVSFQVRLDDRSTLSKLDDLSENIRNQILNSRNCGNCSSKCENKKYVFSYNKKKYSKCRYLCSNFSFLELNKADNICLMNIIKNEIIHKQTGKTIQK